MGFLTDLLNKLFTGLNGAINGMSKNTVKIVRQSYFLLIFLLCAGGIFIGYSRGKETAQIKSAPLAERINQVFEIDINRERKDGRFGKMLESELINEMKYRDPGKIQFPSKDTFKPEFEHRIIEAERDKKISADPSMDPRDSQLEGRYRELNDLNPQVKPLRGIDNPSQRLDPREGIPLEERTGREDTAAKGEKNLKDQPVKDKAVDKIRRDAKKRDLGPIQDHSGIIDK